MNEPFFDMSLSVIGEKVYVRIQGSGVMNNGPSLSQLFVGLHEQGYGIFCFDLEHCSFMDSTFLGLLAKMALNLHEESQEGMDSQLKLFKPSENILRSLKILHVIPYMEIVTDPEPENPDYKPFENNPVTTSKQDLAETSLEAHKVLMNLNDENVTRFKDVVEFLEEDLERLKKSKSP
jgi:anti-sigma B factor antagonist